MLPYLSKAAHHFLYQGTHGSNVDDFKIINIDCAVHVDVLADLSEHCHERNVGFASTLRITWRNVSNSFSIVQSSVQSSSCFN